MGMIANGRAKADLAFTPSIVAKHQRETVADDDERPQIEKFPEIAPRTSQASDVIQRLKEMLVSLTREPRGAINEIEQEIGLLKDRIAEREQVLVEAIDQHANLSKEAVHGMAVVRKALAQIRDAFNAAMAPVTVFDDQAEVTTPAGGNGRA
jgi:hypothetical protein